jgi:hypothetical protein
LKTAPLLASTRSPKAIERSLETSAMVVNS